MGEKRVAVGELRQDPAADVGADEVVGFRLEGEVALPAENVAPIGGARRSSAHRRRARSYSARASTLRPRPSRISARAMTASAKSGTSASARSNAATAPSLSPPRRLTRPSRKWTRASCSSSPTLRATVTAQAAPQAPDRRDGRSQYADVSQMAALKVSFRVVKVGTFTAAGAAG